MQAAHCALVVALKYLPDDPKLSAARAHLEAAIALSDEYYKVYWSIFWNTSPERVKKRIRERCNHLAFDTYSHMIDLAHLLNEYAANKSSEGIPQPKTWRKLIFDLDCAFNWIEQEHPSEIKFKQLTLL